MEYALFFVFFLEFITILVWTFTLRSIISLRIRRNRQLLNITEWDYLHICDHKFTNICSCWNTKIVTIWCLMLSSKMIMAQIKYTNLVICLKNSISGTSCWCCPDGIVLWLSLLLKWLSNTWVFFVNTLEFFNTNSMY